MASASGIASRQQLTAPDAEHRRRQRRRGERSLQRRDDVRSLRVIAGLPRDDDVLPRGQRVRERLPRLAAHDHCVTGRQRAEVAKIGGKPPRQCVAGADDAIARHRRHQRERRRRGEGCCARELAPGRSGGYTETALPGRDEGVIIAAIIASGAIAPGSNACRLPRSFLKFILLGFLLVSLPLVYALAELILSLDRLASQAGSEVLQAAAGGTHQGRLPVRAIDQRALERIARQHLILEDTALLDDYLPVREEFEQTAQQLGALSLETSELATLKQLEDLDASASTSSSALAGAVRDAPAIGATSTKPTGTGIACRRVAATCFRPRTSSHSTRSSDCRKRRPRAAKSGCSSALATVGIAIALAIGFAMSDRPSDPSARPGGPADGYRRLHPRQSA